MTFYVHKCLFINYLRRLSLSYTEKMVQDTFKILQRLHYKLYKVRSKTRLIESLFK